MNSELIRKVFEAWLVKQCCKDWVNDGQKFRSSMFKKDEDGAYEDEVVNGMFVSFNAALVLAKINPILLEEIK